MYKKPLKSDFRNRLSETFLYADFVKTSSTNPFLINSESVLQRFFSFLPKRHGFVAGLNHQLGWWLIINGKGMKAKKNLVNFDIFRLALS